MSGLTYTPIDDIPKIYERIQATFRSGRCRPLEYRRQQLYALVRMCQENVDAIVEAVHNDLKKPRFEVLAYELSGPVSQALLNAKSLDEWAKPEVVDAADAFKPLRPTIIKASKGPVLGIAPWNFPFFNCCFPLIGAITAGSTAVIKPSEISEHTAALFSKLLPKYLDPEAYAVVNGGVPEITKLLELRWAHIVYTGNGRVARIISAAAAKHLTPVTLELGGKSPVIIDSEYDFQLAAKRILVGKTVNSGQICMAPDYVLVHKDKQDAFVDALKAQLKVLYPTGQLDNPSYSRVVSRNHFLRLKTLLETSKGTVALDGRRDEESLQFETTIVKDVTGDDSLMSEEIFGPILAVIPVSSLDEALEFVNARDHPLMLYVFTENDAVKQRFVDETISGSIQFNGVMQHIAGLPFGGGVGESGHGSQGYKHGFDDLTYKRGFVDVPKESEPVLNLLYPPYNDQALQIITGVVQQPIPS